jgi:hypothetical protein
MLRDEKASDEGGDRRNLSIAPKSDGIQQGDGFTQDDRQACRLILREKEDTAQVAEGMISPSASPATTFLSHPTEKNYVKGSGGMRCLIAQRTSSSSVPRCFAMRSSRSEQHHG